MAKLVNKQFNSPIGLYSEQNIREVIARESQILSNGAVGINFNSPGAGKPANLQNSAVLRMLEEEEQRQRTAQSPSRPLRDQITWPPPEYEQRNPQKTSFNDVITPGLKRVAWPPPNEGEIENEQAPAQTQGGLQYSSQSPNLQNNYTPAPQQQVPHSSSPFKPLNISNGTQSSYQSSLSSPLANQSPLGYQPPAPSSNRPWASIHSPTTSQLYQPTLQPYQSVSPPYQSQQYQPVAASNQAGPQYSHPPPVRQVEPPPSTITLRQQAPVSQAPPPLVTSQPATATLKGGKNLRGDLKWPPETVKRQSEEENRLRLELAKGPACRPRLVRRDYGPFFAQNALNSSYPSYKVPPGTQFYDNAPAY